MGKTKITSWKDCRSESNVTQAIKNAGGNITECAGSHVKGEIPGYGTMTYYHSNNISTGVAVKIFKWLKGAGIVVVLLWYLLSRNVCNETNYTAVQVSPSGDIVYLCQ